jgi:uncharacterized protein (TIGR02996 family)
MSSDRLALLSTIRANPRDDAPRLALADWLDQQGESAFARYIRLELERDQLLKSDPRWDKLQEEVRVLWKTPMDWNSAGIYTQTSRGLPYFIETDVLALRDCIHRLGPYAPEPFVFLSGDRQTHQEAEAELASGGTDRIGTAIQDLFRSPWVREWSELQLASIRITAGRAHAMIAPDNLSGLSALCVTDGADDGAVQVLSQAHWPRLSSLGIQEVRRSCGEESLLTTASIHALLNSSLIERIEGLLLVGHWLTNDGLQALAESSRLVGLKSLFIWPKPNSLAGVRAILESPHLAQLTRLDLSGVALDDEMVALLQQPVVLPGLRTLVIAFESMSYRTSLLPRFGAGLFVGSDEEPQEEVASSDEGAVKASK